MSSPLLSNRLFCHCQYFCPKNPHHKHIVTFINSFDRKNRKQSDIKVKMAKKTLRNCRRFILKCNFHFILSQLKPFWKPLSINFHLFMHNYLFLSLIISINLLISKKNPPLFKDGGFYNLLKRFNTFGNYSSIARAFVGAFI
ncbi:hypothetical protein BN1804_02910 [Proteus penneri]|uniref:Uncharacterized protein n=1 Tax=Proteus penneri TaxID=102862 RepID=A0A0G4QF88_9GAMM|nr:hypothetical protein BN1804_02910 [Proteus penneri]